MEVSLSSATSTHRLCSFPQAAESFHCRRAELNPWLRCSLSLSRSKITSQPLFVRTVSLPVRSNSVKILSIQKREVPVLEGKCMDVIYDALAARLVPTVMARTNPNFKHIVGLAGPPGSGKSTLASEVVQRINKLWLQRASSLDSQVKPPDVSAVLPMDGFHLYRSQLDAMEDPKEAHARRGAPWTFNPELLLKCLKTLRDQGSVYVPSFDHGVGDPVENDVFVSLQHKVVIVEGNYLMLEDGAWEEISSFFDEKWFTP